MTDRYTKIVLTEIAVMLSIIAVRDLPRGAVAQADQMRVIIDKVEPLAFQSATVHVKIQN